jgi:hypothetical protein
VAKNKTFRIMAAEKRGWCRVEGNRYLQMISSNCMKENM